MGRSNYSTIREAARSSGQASKGVVISSIRIISIVKSKMFTRSNRTARSLRVVLATGYKVTGGWSMMPENRSPMR